MVCPSCPENRPDRKFCAECGIALAAACPSCGAANQPGERFCGECGTALTGVPASRAAAGQPAVPPAAERRLVSVLFADLVGFTSLSDTRDPEDVRDLLTRYFETSREVVGRYGGTVDKFIGDAVVAVWRRLGSARGRLIRRPSWGYGASDQARPGSHGCFE